MAMRRIFWGFCRNCFLIDPLHYLSSRSDFGFEFAEIFVIKKRLPDSAFEYLKENSASRRVRSAKFIWAPCAQLFSLAEAPHLGSYTIAILVSQERRHLFVTPVTNVFCPMGVSGKQAYTHELGLQLVGFTRCIM
jgi:hypothetical protein